MIDTAAQHRVQRPVGRRRRKRVVGCKRAHPGLRTRIIHPRKPRIAHSVEIHVFNGWLGIDLKARLTLGGRRGGGKQEQTEDKQKGSQGHRGRIDEATKKQYVYPHKIDQRSGRTHTQFPSR